MRPPPVLIRRAVIDPLWLPAAAVLMVLLAVVAALAGLAWPLTRRGRLLRVTLFAMLYLLADACLLVGAAIIWLRWPAAARRDDERWNGAHARLLSRALALLLASARPLFGFRVELEEPPDTSQLPDRPLLVLARHGGPGDSFTLVELLLTRYGRQPRIVMKESLQWDPGLDIVLSRLRCCFLPSRTGAGEDLPGRLAEVARDLRGSDQALGTVDLQIGLAIATDFHELEQVGCSLHGMALKKKLPPDPIRRTHQGARTSCDVRHQPVCDTFQIAREIEFRDRLAIAGVRP